jgi:hypothetical protein
VRRVRRGTRIEVLVKWVGYIETTWELLDSVKDSKALNRYKGRFGRISPANRQQNDSRDRDLVISTVKIRRGVL